MSLCLPLQIPVLSLLLATSLATSLPEIHTTRFNREGLKYISEAKLIDQNIDRTRDIVEAIQAAILARDHTSPTTVPTLHQSGGTLRATFDGHLYSDAQDLVPKPAVETTLPIEFSPIVRDRHLSIFGADTRVTCPASTAGLPWSAIGEVSMIDSQGRFICSGVMVGSDTVLTAAHCVYSRSLGAFFKTINFQPGQSSSETPFGEIPWLHVTIYGSYANPSSSDDPNIYDIAIIKLSQQIGISTGWLGIKVPCQQPDAAGSFSLVTAGYPTDKPIGSCITTSCRVTVRSCSDPYLYHTCPTIEGQSGSAMWDQTTGIPLVRAVHNLQWQNNDGSAIYNSAVSITPSHYQSIKSWIGPSGHPQIGRLPRPPTYP